MNIARSINIALAKKDMSRTDLANAMNTTNQTIYAIIKRGSTHTETIRQIADAMGMKVSEFIKLGEE